MRRYCSLNDHFTSPRRDGSAETIKMRLTATGGRDDGARKFKSTLLRQPVRSLAVSVACVQIFLHRADMAWAIYAASCGLTLEQIRDELLIGRDLSKKGNLSTRLNTQAAPKAFERISK